MQSQMNQVNIGAHEIMDCHEVLCSTINGINLFQLYQPYCQDQELKNILQNQLSFMTNDVVNTAVLSASLNLLFVVFFLNNPMIVN